MARYDPDRHHRRSVRLRGYDYSHAGVYFVTLCVQSGMCLLGSVAADAVRLTDAGRMVQEIWEAMPAHYAGVETDAYVVMPNHVHGIIVLTGGSKDPTAQTADKGTQAWLSLRGHAGHMRPNLGQAQGAGPGHDVGALSLGDVVRRFKTMTTKRYGDGVRQRGWPAYEGRLWQRNYYEHIVRNERALVAIREYIRNNPAQWAVDTENPQYTR